MAKQKTQIWTWRVTPLNKKDTRELWEGQQRDVKKPKKEVRVCKEKKEGIWECKMIKGSRWARK